MNDRFSPSDIARETIKQLALRRLTPTPENYSELYGEIAGGHGGVARQMFMLPPDLPAESSLRLGQAMRAQRWAEAADILQGLGAGARPQQGETGEAADPAVAATANWAELIRDLQHGLDLRHATLTPARKRESLEHVLATFSGDPARLHTRLGGLAKSWLQQPSAKPVETAVEAPVTSAREEAIQPVSVTSERESLRALRNLLGNTLQYAVIDRLGHQPAQRDEARLLADSARAAATPAEVQQLAVDLKKFWVRLELAGESRDEVMQALVGLLDMVVNNVGELVADDRWLLGQTERLRTILAGPLEIKTIREAERGFREVVFKQATMKHSLEQAKEALKDMLAGFIERLGTMASHTDEYQNRIGQHTERIRQAEDISQLGQILDHVMSDTRGMQSDMLRARDELQGSREKAHNYEQQIVTLQQELEAVSALVREDPLTRVLNRRGFEEAWAIEVARCDRRGGRICVSVLDVDNFKQLNDTLGHTVGDDALVHLSAIIRGTLRPSDIVARYGGEEFVILLPDVGLDEATSIMVRVQRELTRRFFLHDNKKVLITFSAGITERIVGETEQGVVARADKALYQAKSTGKNKVVPV
jgi:diguanylate cyclase